MTILKKVRKRKGLSQLALARQVGVGKSYICNIEKRVQKPSISLLIDLGRVLRTDPATLLLDEEDHADR